MFNLLKDYFLIFWFTFFLFVLSSAVPVDDYHSKNSSYQSMTLMNGQTSSQLQCDHNRLQRCQQDITTNIQDISGTQSGGYSGMSSGYQSSGHSSDTTARCSAIRQNLDCLLVYTPACQSRGTSSLTDTRNENRNNGGDFVRRAKQTLERYCEQNGQGWRSSNCYTRSEVRNCENQYSFTSNPPSAVSSSSCRNYQDFRDCIVRIVRQSCYSNELQLLATYLVDKSADLSWSCVLTPDYSSSRSDGNYYPNDPSRTGSNGYNYDNRGNTYGNNYGNSYGSGSQHDRDRTTYDRDRNYDRDRTSSYDRDRYGGSSGTYGSYGSQNQPIDRYGGVGGSLYPTTDSCLEKAGYFVRTCEDTLIQRQRDAREGRSSNDVQRRICCALFFYRDCISRVVVDRCRDPSPTAVDILMGARKRDLTVNCREYSRDQCSASSLIQSSFSLLLCTLISLSFFKPNIF